MTTIIMIIMMILIRSLMMTIVAMSMIAFGGKPLFVESRSRRVF
jgi:hypothetical protein